MIERDLILHCSLIPGIGDVAIGKLCALDGIEDCASVYSWNARDFFERASIPFSQAEVLVRGLADKSLLERELVLLQRHCVSWMTCVDEIYPVALKNIYAPPVVLYWRGSAPVFTDIIAWVGSRAANRYARTVTNAFIPELVSAGWSIASGGALGADTMAHEVTLAAGGKTIAIIGSGLLRPYPATNKKLFEQIEATGGSVVSPFPLEMQAMPGNFPARNRIISGLSRVTVVVQAAEKSGARITALQALEQGREVCVVPGDIFDPLSVGCHRLLSEGATPVTSAEDILRAIGCQFNKGFSVVGQDAVVLNTQRQSRAGDALLDLCKNPMTFDELLAALQCEYTALQERLFNLQLDGAVVQDFLGRWTAVA